jgi:hypothetical protein
MRYHDIRYNEYVKNLGSAAGGAEQLTKSLEPLTPQGGRVDSGAPAGKRLGCGARISEHRMASGGGDVAGDDRNNSEVIRI